MAVRQDAWSEEDDLMLADVTLRQIREGGTQLSAFNEAAAQLGRTSAACGFRWNSVVRKQFETSIQLAKVQRKKRAQQANEVEMQTNMDVEVAVEAIIQESRIFKEVEVKTDNEQSVQPDFDGWIRFLKQYKSESTGSSKKTMHLQRQLDATEQENAQLRIECSQLKKRLNEISTDYQTLTEDYKMFVQMMDRARKMTFLSEDASAQKTRFRMEENGNLECFR